MKRPARAPTAKPKSLAEQQTDFTSEGSPLAGKVGTTEPATTQAEATAALTPTGATQAPVKRG